MKKLFIYFKFFISYIIYLPAVLIHELMHALVALITFSKITKFTLFPKIEFKNDGTYKTIYGSVSSIPKLDMFYIFIAIAPLVMWLFAYLILSHIGALYIDYRDGVIDFELNLNILLMRENLIYIYIVWQLFWGGFLSKQDLKVIINGIFSISFFITLLSFIMVYYYKNLITK